MSPTLKLRGNGDQVIDPIEAQNSARALQARARFPYWYMDMPPGSAPFFVPGSAASPAYGAANQIVVASYQCPSNFRGVLKAILNAFDGSGFVPGKNDAFWTIDVDVPLPSVTAGVGYPFDGYSNILTPLGSYANGPWPLYPGLFFADSETVRYKFQTNGVVGVGSPNFTTCYLIGWITPTHLI